ncbi:Spy/CpxP family protein refolding chaperone [Thiomicrorhabdus sp. zzn3]|uniref:Spy/CpxP family protein refolding chaperone n=1 Tax=Thiomicrorhabdus sp. zzn3 TaxID=3039775 RepID=UPI00243715B6|nr:Spy/CpxP family protein refolding chaperone [Thiomicrorhabdus sp. zzn3]MDG6777405.1 Spy/CpxP family protein refolding chaperone [Thiomicrorhabdus sp. zzn3]
MNQSIKSLLLTSIIGFSTFSYAMADDFERPYHHGMMGGAPPMGTPSQGYGPCYGYGPGYGMMYGYGVGPGYGMMQGYGMGPGYGMMYGYGMGPGYGMMYGGPGMLNFNDSQIKQMDQIRNRHFKKQEPLMREIWQERNRLQRLLNSERRDSKAIDRAYDKVRDLERKAFKERMQMQNEMEGILTKEQREALRRGYPGE